MWTYACMYVWRYVCMRGYFCAFIALMYSCKYICCVLTRFFLSWFHTDERSRWLHGAPCRAAWWERSQECSARSFTLTKVSRTSRSTRSSAQSASSKTTRDLTGSVCRPSKCPSRTRIHRSNALTATPCPVEGNYFPGQSSLRSPIVQELRGEKLTGSTIPDVQGCSLFFRSVEMERRSREIWPSFRLASSSTDTPLTSCASSRTVITWPRRRGSAWPIPRSSCVSTGPEY